MQSTVYIIYIHLSILAENKIIYSHNYACTINDLMRSMHTQTPIDTIP